MNKRNVLIIRPRDCRFCVNGYKGLQHTVDYAVTKAFNIVDLQEKEADNPYIDQAVIEHQPFLIDGFGHGNAGVYTANSETPVWFVGEDLTHLAGSVIYLLSCLTANSLGPYFINQGVIGYGGFLISWTWMAESITSDPYDDFLAKGFYESNNEFFHTLLDSRNLQDAYNESVSKYNEWIEWWENSGSGYAANAIKWLIHDRDGLVIYGDPNASAVKCEEFTDKHSCIDAGCWWYDGGCHCEHPPDIADTYDITVKTPEAKAAIHEIHWGDVISNDCPLEMYLKLANEKGSKEIWAQLTNEDELLWSFNRIMEKNTSKEFYITRGFHRDFVSPIGLRLEVGHYE